MGSARLRRDDALSLPLRAPLRAPRLAAGPRCRARAFRFALLGLRGRLLACSPARGLAWGFVYGTDQGAGSVVAVDLRALRLPAQPQRAGSWTTAGPGEEARRQLQEPKPPLRADRRRLRRLREREQGREAGDPRLPAETEAWALVRGARRLRPEARDPMGPDQRRRVPRSDPLRRDRGRAPRRLGLDPRGRDRCAPHGRGHEGGDRQRRLRVPCVDEVQIADRNLRGAVGLATSRRLVRADHVVGPAQRGSRGDETGGGTRSTGREASERSKACSTRRRKTSYERRPWRCSS